MHEHDQEIIMALAEGTLDEAAATDAEAAILACAECSADLELQRFALAALDEVPTPYLTATESARLHTALKTELVGAKTPPVRARSFAWGRWLPAVGIAAVFLVAIVSLPGLIGGSSDDAADNTIAAPALESAETRSATETTAAASTDMMSDGAEAADDFDDETMSLEAAPIEETAGDEAPAATTTTMAMTETTESSDPSHLDGLAFLGNVADLNTEVLREQVRADLVELGEQTALAKSADAAFASCVANNTSPGVAPTLGIPVDSEALLLGIVAMPSGEELVLVAYVPDSVDATVLVTQQAYFCEVVEVLP